jgi:hypothetical protein
MKFIQSAIVIAALFASTEAIRVEDDSQRHCGGSTCEGREAERHRQDKEAKHVEKVVGEAMAKFVAKHEEIEEKRANQTRIEEKLHETEEKEDKANASKAGKENAKDVKHAIKNAEEKAEHDEAEADKKDKINKQKDDQDEALKEGEKKESNKKLNDTIKKAGE